MVDPTAIISLYWCGKITKDELADCFMLPHGDERLDFLTMECHRVILDHDRVKGLDLTYTIDQIISRAPFKTSICEFIVLGFDTFADAQMMVEEIHAETEYVCAWAQESPS